MTTNVMSHMKDTKASRAKMEERRLKEADQAKRQGITKIYGYSFGKYGAGKPSVPFSMPSYPFFLSVRVAPLSLSRICTL